MTLLTILLAVGGFERLANIFIAIVIAALVYALIKMMPITVNWRNLLKILLIVLLLIYAVFYSDHDFLGLN